MRERVGSNSGGKPEMVGVEVQKVPSSMLRSAGHHPRRIEGGYFGMWESKDCMRPLSSNTFPRGEHSAKETPGSPHSIRMKNEMRMP